MIDFFYRIIFKIGCNKLCSAWNKLVALIFGFLYPIYCRFTPLNNCLNVSDRDEGIIISLTSFPERLPQLHLCVRALLSQTVKPDRVILWLYSGECSESTIPKELNELKKYGLEIRYVEENLRPHKKLYYALKEFPQYIIISVDDDNIYSSHLVERLLEAHRIHPRCVCCNMAHEIVVKDHFPDLYNNWHGGAIGKMGCSQFYVAIGGGGVLYPPNCFDKEYFNIDLIKKLALSADDLWLKITEIRLGIPVYKISKHSKIPFALKNTQKVALGKENNGNHKNDVVMRDLCIHYDIDWDNL